jgi:uncharacterized protein YprB with RNaseH-like and TPR domain
VRVAYFDLETTDLRADIGRILIGSILCHDGQLVTFRQDVVAKKKRTDYADDGEIAKLIRDVLEKHDLLIAWNGKGFDIPFLNTRLVQNGHRRLLPKLFLDPKWYMQGWRGLLPRNAKLDTAAEFFRLGERKMDVPVEVWAKAACGNKEAMDTLVERCESDVRILKEATERILASGVVKTISVYP